MIPHNPHNPHKAYTLLENRGVFYGCCRVVRLVRSCGKEGGGSGAGNLGGVHPELQEAIK